MPKMFTDINTILFDMDGTLFDTAPDLTFALNQLRNHYHLPPLSYEHLRPFASAGSRGLLQCGFNITPQHSDYEKLRQEFLTIYAKHITQQTTLFAGMSAVLECIENNNMRWGVVTNKPTQYAQTIINHFQLNQRCACVIGSDSGVRMKPEPDGLILACQLLQVIPNQCLYIGDAERDIIAAKRANMHSMAALYGYLLVDDQPTIWQADIYVNSTDEILMWLANNTAKRNYSSLAVKHKQN